MREGQRAGSCLLDGGGEASTKPRLLLVVVDDFGKELTALPVRTGLISPRQAPCFGEYVLSGVGLDLAAIIGGNPGLDLPIPKCLDIG
jgi:hypothetical protein